MEAVDKLIEQVERHYFIHNRDGVCVDWMGFRERNFEGFLAYLRMRQESRRLAQLKAMSIL